MKIVIACLILIVGSVCGVVSSYESGGAACNQTRYDAHQCAQLDLCDDEAPLAPQLAPVVIERHLTLFVMPLRKSHARLRDHSHWLYVSVVALLDHRPPILFA